MRWTNWGGNQSAEPIEVVQPSDTDEAVSATRRALAAGRRIRVAGAGHSFSPLVPTEGTILDMRRLTGVTGVDSERKRVRVAGGTLISDLGDQLWERGLALANQGDIDRQTVAGAVATGTHGSGAALGSLSSTVTWVRLIDASGEVREIGEAGLEDLCAAQVSMGMLGPVLEVELQAVDAYLLEEFIDYPTWDEVQVGVDTAVREWRHYSYLWLPREDSAALYELDVPDGWKPGATCFQKRYRVQAPGDPAPRGQRVDRSYRIYPGSFDTRFHELEYFVPAPVGNAAAAAVRELLLHEHATQAYPLEVRWLQGDHAYLSPAHETDSTSISVSGAPGTDYEPYLRDVHRLLLDFGARPHWGKLHYFDADSLRRAFPGYDKFLTVRDRYDPEGRFSNDYLDGLFERRL